MIISLSVMLFVLAPLYAATADKIMYVDDDATGVNNGRSWESAFVNLQDGVVDAWDVMTLCEYWLREIPLH